MQPLITAPSQWCVGSVTKTYDFMTIESPDTMFKTTVSPQWPVVCSPCHKNYWYYTSSKVICWLSLKYFPISLSKPEAVLTRFYSFVCWCIFIEQVSFLISTSCPVHMNCSLALASLWVYKVLPGDLGRSWTLEGALTAAGTSDVKKVLSRAQATVKQQVRVYPPLPPLRVTAVGASPCLLCGTSRWQQGVCLSVKGYFSSRKWPCDPKQNVSSGHLKLYSLGKQTA